MTVNVTAQDIATGVTGDCHLCPIARAIQRELLLGMRVSVGGWEVRIWASSDPADFVGVFTLPETASRFIGMFDEQEEVVRPFSFQL